MSSHRVRFLVLGYLIVFLAARTVPAQIAVQGETVYTMAGTPIQQGVVVITDGKISAVGPAAKTPIPAGAQVLKARVVTPGLIDCALHDRPFGPLEYGTRSGSDRALRATPARFASN